MTTAEDALLSTSDVARLYGVSTETIRRWIRLGIIGYVVVGNTHVRKRRTIRIPQSEADRHLRRVAPEV